jgi:hypothetical protein
LSWNYGQELLTERDRIEETVQRALLARRDPADSARKIVGSVYNGGAMPTAVPAWFLTHPADFGCNESEGGPCAPSIDTTSTVPVLVLGPKVPSVGDLLPARMIGGKWVAERGGGGGCTTKICLSSGCGGGATNVLVTILNGSTRISSGATDSTGCVTLSIPSAGSYTVTTSGSARYANTSGTHALTCGGVTTISLSPASGYSCLACWQEPVPNTLFLHVAGTAYPVVNINSGGIITASVPISNLLVPVATANCSLTVANPCTGPTTGNLSVPFIFAAGGCSVDQQWAACTDCNVAALSGSPCPTPQNSANFPNFNNVFITTVFNQQWERFPTCIGVCTVGDSSIVSWTSRPVPVNITINFPVGVDGTNPPVATATLTE